MIGMVKKMEKIIGDMKSIKHEELLKKQGECKDHEPKRLEFDAETEGIVCRKCAKLLDVIPWTGAS